MDTKFIVAYKNIFKELLLPLGYIYHAGVFMRLINDEILQLIYPVKISKFEFTIGVNIKSIYSQSLRKTLFTDGGEFIHSFCDGEEALECTSFEISKNYMNVIEVVNKAANCISKWVLPALEDIKNMDDVLEFYKEHVIQLVPKASSEFLLLVKSKEINDLHRYRELNEIPYSIKHHLDNTYISEFDYVEEVERMYRLINEQYNKIVSNPKELLKVERGLKQRIYLNKNTLKNYGFEIENIKE